MSDTFPAPATEAAPEPEAAPEQEPAPVEPTSVEPAPVDEPHTVGSVVFFEAVEYGAPAPVVHAGLVIHAAAGRVRVKDLGAAVESADFPADAVRSEA